MFILYFPVLLYYLLAKVNLINDNLFSMMNVVAKTVKEVYGNDKLIIFKETLKENFLKENNF